MRNRRKAKGQALVELGIIVALLITITLGAVEFGYAFLALHTVTQATAAGARAASVLQVGNRDACGRITNTSSIQALVLAQVGNVATVSSVQVQQVPAITGDGVLLPCSTAPNGLPKVQVTVQGTIPRVFGLLGSSPRNFTRTETFRDEGV